MQFDLLLKLEKLSNAPKGPSIFNVIQDSLRDLRSLRKAQNALQYEDSMSTVITETQETTSTEISISSESDANLQNSKPEELMKLEVELVSPLSKKIAKLERSKLKTKTLNSELLKSQGEPKQRRSKRLLNL